MASIYWRRVNGKLGHRVRRSIDPRAVEDVDLLRLVGYSLQFRGYVVGWLVGWLSNLRRRVMYKVMRFSKSPGFHEK
jgi:hypothetical protein